MQRAFFQSHIRGLHARDAQSWRRIFNSGLAHIIAASRKLVGLLLIFTLLVPLAAQGETAGTPDYAQVENWAYIEENSDKPVDIFFVCPTVYGGGEGVFNMDMEDAETKASFLGATNMEKGIYDESGRFFAPYYRQAGLNVYALPEEEREAYLALAYEDVRAAFSYYLEHYNDGRPIVLAGFSQGADMCIRLLKDFFADEEVNGLLVACYAIGWRITEEELEEYPHLRFAAGEDDTGVIIAFNSEAEDVTDSLMIPAGTRTLAINPLNWETDGTPAGKEENLGACFTDYSGEIVTEIPQLTGAYIDPERGALKVPDVSPDDYPPGLIFSPKACIIFTTISSFIGICRKMSARASMLISPRGSRNKRPRSFQPALGDGKPRLSALAGP